MYNKKNFFAHLNNEEVKDEIEEILDIRPLKVVNTLVDERNTLSLSFRVLDNDELNVLINYFDFIPFFISWSDGESFEITFSFEGV